MCFSTTEVAEVFFHLWFQSRLLSSSVRMSVNVSLQPSEFGCLDCSTVFKLVQDNFPSAVLTVSKSVHVACGLIMFLFCLADPGC